MTEIWIDCHIVRDNTSKSQQIYSYTNFAHNVSFSGKKGNFSEIIFHQNCSVWSVALWNRTAISIDCNITRG